MGVGTLQGEVIQGFGGLGIPLGSLLYPWPLEMPELLAPTDELRSKDSHLSGYSSGGNELLPFHFLGMAGTGNKRTVAGKMAEGKHNPASRDGQVARVLRFATWPQVTIKRGTRGSVVVTGRKLAGRKMR